MRLYPRKHCNFIQPRPLRMSESLESSRWIISPRGDDATRFVSVSYAQEHGIASNYGERLLGNKAFFFSQRTK